MEVNELLQGWQINCPSRPHPLWIVRVEFLHDLTSALYNAHHSRFSHEHMVCFFGEHKLEDTRQWLNPGFSQSRKLILAITIREVGEHQVRQPMRRLLVEGAQ